MSRLGIFGCVALCACRIGFDPLAGDGGPTGDGGDGGGMPGSHIAYLKASNTDALDEFGASLAISRDGSTIAVGAPLESSQSTVINSGETDNSAPEAGAVYIFVRSGNTWTQQAYIKAANADAGDQFGWSVALSGDGNLLVVGGRNEDSLGVAMPGNNAAMDAGAVYVFARTGSTWAQQGYMKAQALTAGDKFGEDVAISDDGSTIAVGTPLEDSNATTINGSGLDDSNPQAGAAYVFAYVGNQWSQVAYIKAANNDAGDLFGWRVALSATGDVLAVGAYAEDSNANTINGNDQDDSFTNAGATYLFTRSGMTWSPAAYLKESNNDQGDDFGYDVAVSGDGTTVAVTAEGEASAGAPTDNSAPVAGALYMFRSGPWTQTGYLKASNVEANDELGFGVTTTTSGDIVVVGAPFEKSSATGIDGNQGDNSMMKAGAAYWFQLVPPFDRHYYKATNTGADDKFGWQCAISGTGAVLAISASFEDGSGTGVDPPSNDAAMDSGAVYVYY